MKHLLAAIAVTWIIAVSGCASDKHPGGPGSRDAWLGATGGRFDGSRPSRNDPANLP